MPPGMAAWQAKGLLHHERQSVVVALNHGDDRIGLEGLELYKLLRVRDKEMARAFDDFRRSTAVFCLRLMVSYGVLAEEDLSQFSPETRHIATDEF